MSSSAYALKLSRQKSCAACARAKRRCFPQTPQCPRCASKGLQCVYKNDPLLTRSRHADRSPSGARTLPEERNWDPTATSAQACVGPVAASNELITILEGTDDFFDERAISQWLSENAPPLDITLTLPLDGFGEVAYVDRWAADQMVRCLKTYPLMFSKLKFTSFIHARLYDAWLPDSIGDAFMLSATYSTRTKANEAMVFRILEQKTTSLLQQDTVAWTLDEHLAAVQALMLLYIIQIFDGDVRLRVFAESYSATLDAWTVQLRSRIPALSSKPTWQAWLFAESARRTVIFSLFISGIYSVLKRGFCTNVPKMRGIPITCKTDLWNAQTGAAWIASTESKKPEVIEYGEFARQWEEGLISGKLECFQKILLTPCVGEKYRDVLEIDTDIFYKTC